MKNRNYYATIRHLQQQVDVINEQLKVIEKSKKYKDVFNLIGSGANLLGDLKKETALRIRKLKQFELKTV